MTQQLQTTSIKLSVSNPGSTEQGFRTVKVWFSSRSTPESGFGISWSQANQFKLPYFHSVIVRKTFPVNSSWVSLSRSLRHRIFHDFSRDHVITLPHWVNETRTGLYENTVLSIADSTQFLKSLEVVVSFVDGKQICLAIVVGPSSKLQNLIWVLRSLDIEFQTCSHVRCSESGNPDS